MINHIFVVIALASRLVMSRITEWPISNGDVVGLYINPPGDNPGSELAYIEMRIVDSMALANAMLLILEDGSTLSLGSTINIYKSPDGDFVSAIDADEAALEFRKPQHEEVPTAFRPLRGLRGKSKGSHTGQPPETIVVPPPITGEFNAYPSEVYCRYGCGNLMGITFPYYYRPFFGYGFPLLGTENQWQSGYGGNPMTMLGAAGLLSGGSVGNLG